MQHFGERVAFYRKERKLNQGELADRINNLGNRLPNSLTCEIVKDRISRIERGVSEPTLSEITAFSYALEIGANCLINDLCNLTKDIVLHDIEQICNEMGEAKREEFLKFMAMQADYVHNNIMCGKSKK